VFQTDDNVGPYTLVRQLGEGGFGVVWLAEKRATYTKTKFALKLPKPARVNPGAIEEEAKLWEKGSGHRNVVPIIEGNEYDVIRNGQVIAPRQIVIVSEFVPDGTLEKWLEKQGGRASVEAATAMISEILEGLVYLHSQGIIHRDLKPANIILQGQTPRIADFGISRALTTGTYHFTGPLGSLPYMAPETIANNPSNRRISKRTDLWSVGVIYYELLTGDQPFPLRSMGDIAACMEAIRKAIPPPLPSYVPLAIQNVIKSALRRNPKKRFQSASEMLRAVKTASRPVPVPAPPIPVVQGPSALDRIAAFRLSRRLIRNTILVLVTLTLIFIGWTQYINLPKSYLESGMRKLNGGDEDGAIADLSYVISREKDNAEAYLLLGHAFYNKGTKEDLQKAISNYSMFINLEKDEPEGYIRRALSRRILCDCDQAIEDLTIAINLKNDRPDSYTYRADVFDDKGDYSNAIKDLDQAIQLRNDDPELYISRARLFRQRNSKGDTENAIKDLTRAIETGQNKPEYYILRATLFSDEGRIDLAIKDYDEVINRQKDSPDNYIARAKLFFAKGDVTNGIKNYDQAIKLKEGAPSLYFERGNILIQQEKYDLAIEDFDRYSNVNKDAPAAYYNRGICYYYKGDYTKAIEQLTQAVKLSSSSAPNENVGYSYYMLGLSYFDSENYDKAIEGLTQAINIWLAYDKTQNTAASVDSPSDLSEETCTCNPAEKISKPAEKPKPVSVVNPDAYFFRGLAYLNKNRRNDAVADLRKTVELTTDDERRIEAQAKLRSLGVK
jgi:tetratricopeptide (TPR) repeat protein